MKTLLIWGAGDQGMVTLECAQAMNVYSRIDLLEIREKGHREFPGHTIYREQDKDLDALLGSYDEVVVASGDNTIREEKLLLLKSMGITAAVIVHPTAFISPSAHVSEGCMIFANAVIHTNASVGWGCIVNTAAVIEHDCVVGDFVNISPKVSMAGHTKIGNKTFLGIGSTVIDGIAVGKETVIGAGAVVIRNVEDGATAVGVPAENIRE